ncbi:hypothetical protein [Pseudomonas chlororaphis]|uniref:Ead/Ea22-like family protein n=1 Tax=Pseudomonas chlororaphis O6 TaxID=1037915 RepID=A0AB33WLG1_9PSED|nr:hypothetical protein [Pseudomonas chlororaphis]EIM13880.1 hypothetical protein PchlO6_2129 [Pseudomonas chlororaphis O6]
MTDYTKLKRLAIAAQNDNGDYEALNDYGMAVPPAVVLALIAENERLQSAARTLERLRYTDNGGELWKPPVGKQPDFDLIDQLKAENARSTERELLQLAEIEALRKRIDDMSPFKGAPLTGPDLKCLACGEYHYGLQGLPCPNMCVTASAAMGKGEQS